MLTTGKMSSLAYCQSRQILLPFDAFLSLLLRVYFVCEHYMLGCINKHTKWIYQHLNDDKVCLSPLNCSDNVFVSCTCRSNSKASFVNVAG